jgi:DNA-binding winged helix-turn-helix (wHTH) protein/TolB-like protein
MLNGRVRFGDFEADLTSGELRRGGTAVPIQDLPFRLLAVLLERPGEVVTRAELTERLWGSSTFVDAAAGLNTAVAKLRDALEDNAERPAFVETVPKRGYRFVGPVLTGAMGPAAAAERPLDSLAPPPAIEASSKRRRARTLWIAAALGAVLLAAGITYRLRADRGQVRVAVVLFDNETGRPEMARFAQGLTDATVTQLTADDRLAVIGNAAVLRTERPFRDIAKVRDALGADYVVIGQVQNRDAETIVRAHLIRARDQAHVWVDVATLTGAGEAALQADVAGRVRAAVAGHAFRP